ncbi:MAG TPA: 2-phospho-L-lactate transferase [Acidimicrobiales bacterium]|nr:2-phospho-L-lactate transferase [Acidimicrobiales bacterium]
MIAVLCGGVGAARFLSGLVEVVDPAEILAIVNTGDDTVMHGLSISPDLDTITYTLSGKVNPLTGWGLAGDEFSAMDALAALGGPTWFRLGNLDLATHMFRSGRLAEGATLSQVTEELGRAFGLGLKLVPMSDQPVRTRLELLSGEEVSFQEYFVKLRHGVAVRRVRFAGAEASSPSPGVLDALASADVIAVAPSNPAVSIDPILSVPGIRAALQARRDRVVAVSPIVAGAALKGPADRLLAELGGQATAAGVARWLRDVIGTLVIDQADAGLCQEVEAAGVACVVTPTVMSEPGVAARLAGVVISAAGANCS